MQLGMPIGILGRMLRLALIFGPCAMLAAPLYGHGGADSRRLANRLIFWSLQVAGATFIKLGQWASTRPDLLPGDLCTVLSGLHTQAPAHAMAWNRAVIRGEFGRELEELFCEFCKEPVGSGTVAQVHRARLAGSGAEVAVKICHPRVQSQVERDLALLAIGAGLLSHLPMFRWLSLPEELHHFSLIMKQQLDLRHEAYSLAQMSRNFYTWHTVHIPMPVYPLVSRRALVQTFAQGTSIGGFLSTSFDQSLSPVEAEVWRQSKQSLATVGLQSFLQMLLWDNFVHADLHPGNILVRFVDRQGRIRHSAGPSIELVHRIVNEDLQPQIVYLDAGLVTQLSRRDFSNFNDLFVALVLRADGRRAGRLIIERSPDRYKSLVRDAEGFCAAMDEVVRPIFRNINLQLGQFAVGSALFQVFDLVRKHHVHLDGSFTNLVMSFVCVEGLGRQLAPQLNLIPFLARAALQYLVTNVSYGLPR